MPDINFFSLCPLYSFKLCIISNKRIITHPLWRWKWDENINVKFKRKIESLLCWIDANFIRLYGFNDSSNDYNSKSISQLIGLTVKKRKKNQTNMCGVHFDLLYTAMTFLFGSTRTLLMQAGMLLKSAQKRSKSNSIIKQWRNEPEKRKNLCSVQDFPYIITD